MGMLDKLDKAIERDKQRIEHLNQKKEEKKAKQPSEQEKLAKTGNTIIKGIAFWYMLPVFAIAFILIIFVGLWIFDSIAGMF